jgi:alanyl-tRNA synthetase
LAKNYNEKSARIIADHVRAATFMIADGVTPSNTEQGYVLRRLLRRAVRSVSQIGLIQETKTERSDLSYIAQLFIEQNISAYPNLAVQSDKIFREIEMEEEKFRKTLANGLKEFEKGIDAFDLLQSYGFPIELTVELAKEKGASIDINEFNKKMKKHQEVSRAGSEQKFKGGLASHGVMETKYHTATHLLLASLQQALKSPIVQKGSNITAERLRFDFNWPEKVSKEKLKEVEDLVNEKIKVTLPVEMIELPKKEAQKIATTLAFDLSTYPDIVTVYKIGIKNGQPFSIEFCGGPHVKNTSELGHFKIVKEEASSAGVRRIKAVLE